MINRYFRRGAIRVLPLLCLLVSANDIQADIVRGRVIDTDSKESVPLATLKFEQRFDNGTATYFLTADSIGNFLFFADGKGTLQASMLGYYPKSKMVFAYSDSRKDTIDVGAIELKMSPYMLEMVEVNARARRFSVKGDTIVFHPEAFRLEEGARLDELIRQLPGVEVTDDGSLTWNGKPIRITMDGDALFGSDELIQQLPAEAVQDIKAYNKASRFSERTGRDDGTEDIVLDLTIKPGFLERWYGDVTAGGAIASPESFPEGKDFDSPILQEGMGKAFYEADLRMNRLSKNDPVMVSVNANNNSRQIRRRMNGGSVSMPFGYGKEQGAAAGYQHKWRRTTGSHELKSNYSFSGGLANDDQWRAMNEETLNYLPDAATQRTTNENALHSHKLNPYLGADLSWDIDSLNSLWVRLRADHTDATDVSSQTTRQVGILTQEARTLEKNRRTSLSAETSWSHFVKDGALDANVMFSYSDRQEEQLTERQAYPLPLPEGKVEQHGLGGGTSISARANGHWKRWLTERWLVDLSYTIEHQRNMSHRDFETNNVPDDANSYDDRHRLTKQSLGANSTLNLGTLQLLPSFSARWLNESEDYRRGQLDTTAQRRRLIIDPQASAVWKITKTTRIEGSYSYATSQPRLIETLAYRDATDPLAITEGNPLLKDMHAHKAGVRFSTVWAPHQLSLSLSADYAATDCETRTALRYDPVTAVYTSRPENVRGSRTWNFRMNYDQGLGEYIRLQNDLRMAAGRSYGFLLRLPDDERPALNRQNSLHPSDRLTATLEWQWLNVSLFANLDADCLRFSASSSQNTTLWQNSYGGNIRVTRGNWEFKTSLTENVSAGYAVAAMNRHRLIWDGSVSWKILKGKGHLRLDLDDILNTNDRIYATQTANQQSTVTYAYRHHFAALTFTYHLDAKAKE